MSYFLFEKITHNNHSIGYIWKIQYSKLLYIAK
jgi:hypothetical protein